MATLFLSAPKDKDAASGLHRTFGRILNEKIGPDYAIAANLVAQIVIGMKVVVFDRVGRKQAEGALAGLSLTGHRTLQGILRYNVSIPDLHEAQYMNPPHVNRQGVKVV